MSLWVMVCGMLGLGCLTYHGVGVTFTSLGKASQGQGLLGTLRSWWVRCVMCPWPEHLRPALHPWVCACLSCRMWWCRVFRFNPEPWAPRGRFAQPAHSHHFRSHSTDLTTRGLARYVCPHLRQPKDHHLSSLTPSFWQCLESGHTCLCYKTRCYL